MFASCLVNIELRRFTLNFTFLFDQQKTRCKVKVPRDACHFHNHVEFCKLGAVKKSPNH